MGSRRRPLPRHSRVRNRNRKAAQRLLLLPRRKVPLPPLRVLPTDKTAISILPSRLISSRVETIRSSQAEIRLRPRRHRTRLPEMVLQHRLLPRPSPPRRRQTTVLFLRRRLMTLRPSRTTRTRQSRQTTCRDTRSSTVMDLLLVLQIPPLLLSTWRRYHLCLCCLSSRPRLQAWATSARVSCLPPHPRRTVLLRPRLKLP